MNCEALELATSTMWFIGLVAFWLGICFVAGMRAFGTGTLLALSESIKLAQELLNQHIKSR